MHRRCHAVPPIVRRTRVASQSDAIGRRLTKQPIIYRVATRYELISSVEPTATSSSWIKCRRPNQPMCLTQSPIASPSAAHIHVHSHGHRNNGLIKTEMRLIWISTSLDIIERTGVGPSGPARFALNLITSKIIFNEPIELEDIWFLVNCDWDIGLGLTMIPAVLPPLSLASANSWKPGEKDALSKQLSIFENALVIRSHEFSTHCLK